MLASELQTSATSDPATGKPGRAPGLDLDALLAHLRATLPAGKWRIASFRTVMPAASNTSKQASGDPEEPKTDDPSPDNAPIKPGGPKIEVVYEWTES